TMRRHKGWVTALAFTPNGSSLVSAGDDGLVVVWDTASGHARGALSGHKGPVTALAIHPRGENLITGGAAASLLPSRGTNQASIRAPQTGANPPNNIIPPADGPVQAERRFDDTPEPERGSRTWLTALVITGFVVVVLIAAAIGAGLHVLSRRRPQPD